MEHKALFPFQQSPVNASLGNHRPWLRKPCLLVQMPWSEIYLWNLLLSFVVTGITSCLMYRSYSKLIERAFQTKCSARSAALLRSVTRTSSPRHCCKNVSVATFYLITLVLRLFFISVEFRRRPLQEPTNPGIQAGHSMGSVCDESQDWNEAVYGNFSYARRIHTEQGGTSLNSVHLCWFLTTIIKL